MQSFGDFQESDFFNVKKAVLNGAGEDRGLRGKKPPLPK